MSPRPPPPMMSPAPPPPPPGPPALPAGLAWVMVAATTTASDLPAHTVTAGNNQGVGRLLGSRIVLGPTGSVIAIMSIKLAQLDFTVGGDIPTPYSI
jgi:hypothetical protein